MGNRILNVAIDIARNLTHKKYRIAAIITDRRNKILSIGWNSYSKSHPEQLRWAKKNNNHHKIWLHAEISALVRCKDGIPYHIYIARVYRNGQPAMASPCLLCADAIKHAGIKKVIYTQSP